ncbi:melatonin receptor type 1A-like [Phlebotomus papatasi]|uniref:melatonin receptor type 1A-like n=1 Tax=Phlebotomus papatasi TaxID=29031 RepID=UPI002483E15B|nr:melatonin receptor type 1A-like [Phlebotomus papatasi]
MNLTETLITSYNVESVGSLNVTSLDLYSKNLTRQFNIGVNPIYLSSSARLAILSCLFVIGSLGNVFLITSFTIEDHLKKVGNAFIVSAALADLLITSLLIPTSIILLMARIANSADSMSFCKFEWFLAVFAFMVNILSLLMIAVENYFRLCAPHEHTTKIWFNKFSITATFLLIWIISGMHSGMEVLFSLGFDHCTRKFTGIVPYQMGILILLIILPIFLTFYTHVRIILDVPRFVGTININRCDVVLARTNFYSFIIFIIFWMPFVIFIYSTTKIIPTSEILYWLGLSKSCFNNIVYCLTNRHFRRAYGKLFQYCFCKEILPTSRSSSRRRRKPCQFYPQYKWNYHWYWGDALPKIYNVESRNDLQ